MLLNAGKLFDAGKPFHGVPLFNAVKLRAWFQASSGCEFTSVAAVNILSRLATKRLCQRGVSKFLERPPRTGGDYLQ